MNLDIKLFGDLETLDLLKNNVTSTEEVKKLMDEHDLVVDFFTTNTGEKFCTYTDSMLYEGVTLYTYEPDYYLYANILRKEWETPIVVCLGKISEANTESGTNLLGTFHYGENAPDKINDKINELYESQLIGDYIWSKILSKGQVREGDRIFFVPSGAINRLAIENLPVSDSGITDIEVKRISSLSEVNKLERLYDKNDKCVTFGDIKFQENSDKKDVRKLLNSDPDAILKRDLLSNNLPKVTPVLTNGINTKFLKGENANEMEFEKLSGDSPEILTFYTHGYNYERVTLPDSSKDYLLGKNRTSTISKSEMGMFTSGLFLSEPKSDDVMTDGMLTAHEVSMCDLSNTSLVILAACSSAIGSISPEGVYGLQRGFKIAGAGSILASLWDVDSDATNEFIAEFFRNYRNGETKQKSLIKAKEHIKTYKSKDASRPVNWSDPYYWSGFILID